MKVMSNVRKCALKRAFLYRLRKLGVIDAYINNEELRKWSVYE